MEHSITNYVSRTSKRGRGHRKRNDDDQNVANLIPLELNESANNSYLSYQSALAAAVKQIVESEENSLDNLVLSFSRFNYYDPCTKSYKTPALTSANHIIFIFENSEYFSNRYFIEDNKIFKK
ncbi:hypothetical protein TRFO_20691 [Tritrichomonas foetus]|uniref:Uncharacterized protein n=1 Tax=Tritrichomonas foetus TaxID=1144522 RepID=A0A1J4KKD1_9EUKA|nr:hypothetical protein TRFO_20691 [Tritrichomonas foetus]|eukprot:OHT10142.1 hypothetical protein TRFO_20691 [Tritrichomonas foetus]